ncbi:glycosyltransferase [Pseudomonadota bacterium]
MEAIDRGLDILFVISMWPGLVTLDHVARWREKCDKVVYYLFDAFPTEWGLNIFRNSFVNDVDLFVVSFYEALDFFDNNIETNVIWVPQGINPERFSYKPWPRPIFCSAMGRQHEVFFSKTLEYCSARDHMFMYQGEIGGPRRTWQHSYNLYAQILRNSKYILNWAGTVTQENWESGFRNGPPTCRWFEAAAAGGLQVGIPPESLEFESLFPNDAIVDVREYESEPEAVFGHLEELGNEGIEAKTRSLSMHTLAKHTWFNRIYTILSRLGLEEAFNPPPISVELDLSTIFVEGTEG